MVVPAKCLDAEASSILLLHKLFRFVAFRFQSGSWDLKRLIETTTVDKVTYLRLLVNEIDSTYLTTFPSRDILQLNGNTRWFPK